MTTDGWNTPNGARSCGDVDAYVRTPSCDNMQPSASALRERDGMEASVSREGADACMAAYGGADASIP